MNVSKDRHCRFGSKLASADGPELDSFSFLLNYRCLTLSTDDVMRSTIP